MRSSLDFGRIPVEIIQMHHRNAGKQRGGKCTARPAARWTERPNPYRSRSCINVSYPQIDTRNPLPTLSALIHRFLSPLQSATYLTTPLCFGRLAKYWQQSKIRSSFNSDPPSYQHSTISWLRPYSCENNWRIPLTTWRLLRPIFPTPCMFLRVFVPLRTAVLSLSQATTSRPDALPTPLYHPVSSVCTGSPITNRHVTFSVNINS
jgi:hypothetical protein